LSPFSPRVVFSMYLLLSCCSFILFLLHIYISCIYIDVIQPFHAIKKPPRPPARAAGRPAAHPPARPRGGASQEPPRPSSVSPTPPVNSEMVCWHCCTDPSPPSPLSPPRPSSPEKLSEAAGEGGDNAASPAAPARPLAFFAERGGRSPEVSPSPPWKPSLPEPSPSRGRLRGGGSSPRAAAPPQPPPRGEWGSQRCRRRRHLRTCPSQLRLEHSCLTLGDRGCGSSPSGASLARRACRARRGTAAAYRRYPSVRFPRSNCLRRCCSRRGSCSCPPKSRVSGPRPSPPGRKRPETSSGPSPPGGACRRPPPRPPAGPGGAPRPWRGAGEGQPKPAGASPPTAQACRPPGRRSRPQPEPRSEGSVGG